MIKLIFKQIVQKRLKSGLYDDIYSFSSSQYEGKFVEQKVIISLSTHEDVTDSVLKGKGSSKRRSFTA